MGTVISSVISCLGEMTALMPVNAPVMEFPRRFLDRGVGLAVGWIYWFAYAVLAADELVAFSNSVKFSYDDGRTFLNWKVGNAVDPAVWVTLALVLCVTINMLPVRVCSNAISLSVINAYNLPRYLEKSSTSLASLRSSLSLCLS
jgi:amino acid transporter